MNEYFRFGHYYVRIVGIEVIPTHVMEELEQYRVVETVPKYFCIRISNGTFPSCQAGFSGWMTIRNGQEPIVCYCTCGVPSFSLALDSCNRRIELVIAEEYIHNAKVALNYALMLVLATECIGLHGATVICGHKAIILSAPSGTGKSTLANLLRAYCDVAIVNGDFALLHPNGSNQVIFEPTPFCGSSRICHNAGMFIDRIVFLKQAKENIWRDLSDRESLRFMMSNVFTPEWSAGAFEHIQNTVVDIVRAIPMSEYSFSPSPQAAHDFMKSLLCET